MDITEEKVPSSKTKQTATEYAEAVREWIVQYNLWHQQAMFNITFPYYMMGCMSAQTIPQTHTRTQPSAYYQPGTPSPNIRNEHHRHTPIGM